VPAALPAPGDHLAFVRGALAPLAGLGGDAREALLRPAPEWGEHDGDGREGPGDWDGHSPFELVLGMALRHAHATPGGLTTHHHADPENLLVREGRDGPSPPPARAAALGLLAELWRVFPAAMKARPGEAKRALSCLKRGVRDPAPEVRFDAVGILFELMAEFARTRNAFAPVVYKTIIFALIESHKDRDGGELRGLILGRLGATLGALPHLPVGVMVDPLTKQLSLHSVCR